VASLVALMAWKASVHRIDALASEPYVDIYGAHRTYPNISGHRQVGATDCPGSHLYALLPELRHEVAAAAGNWSPLVVDIPAVLRYEIGALRAAASGTTASTTTGTGAAGTGTALVGYRVLSTGGTVYTAGGGRVQGNPAANGMKDAVALANSPHGDGYWALGRSGTVLAFGGVATFGDAHGKGTAVDLAVTKTGLGYWILLADGTVLDFGDAPALAYPKNSGVTGSARRIAARPQSDGYWVLMADGSIHPYGSAATYRATGSKVAAAAVDLTSTPSGKGYWAVSATGAVTAFGDAVDKGDVARSSSKWKKSTVAIIATPSGHGYALFDSEGAMRCFGDAPAFASFAGSGITVAGVAPAFGTAT
ncbi:MAG TPA: hypothetical protein VGM78_13215, partial [Ilumatobacteraceae bacterium]